MKVFTVVLAVLLAFLSAWTLIPPPTMALLPLALFALELSPWLVLFNLLAGLLALRFCRAILPLAVVSLLVSCWPVVQIFQVIIHSSNQGREETHGNGHTASILLRSFSDEESGNVRPQHLEKNILYYPPATSGALSPGLSPAVIDIYGGGWQHGSPQDMHRFDSYLAMRGFAVFAIDYRHAPAFKFPSQLDDVNSALRFLSDNAARFQIDSNRLVLCGRSAGAQLALLAAYQKRPVPVRAVVSYYGPTDLLAGYLDPPVPDPLNVRAVLEAYLGGPPEQAGDAYRAASPVNYVRPSLPATLLIQGKRDHIVKDEFARELYNRLSKSGSPVVLVELPWAEHAFDFVPFGLGKRVVRPYLEDFLHDAVGR